MQHAAIGQRKIGDEMRTAVDLVHGQIGYRCIHMRDQVQAGGPRPCAFDADIDEVVAHQLGNGERAVYMRDELE